MRTRGERYYLFRGDELVYRTEDHNGQIGAGDSHKLGQPGDVLVLEQGKILMGFHWQKGDRIGKQAHWGTIDTLDPKYRVLIMLQI